ncbi:MAG: glycosyltransferase [Pseudomonadota bacterium]
MMDLLVEQYPEFFDLEFVRQNYPDANTSSDGQLLADLVDHQNTQPFRPNPIFDCRYYKEKALPARLSDACNPIVHFLEQGDFEGLQPNLFFCPTYYRRNNADARAPGINSVVHALVNGLSSLTTPHLLVDVEHISSQLSDVEVETVARELFLGVLGRVDPHPLLSIECLEQSTGRSFQNVAEALAFYLKHPGEPQTHPLLEPPYLRAQLGTADATRKTLVHYLESHGSHDPHPLFDSAYYRAQVFSHRGGISGAPLLHFVKQGARSQLSPSPYFDLSFYRRVSDCHDDAFKHYLLRGGFRHHPPHPLIDLDDHHAAKASGLARSEIPAVDVALRARNGEGLAINLVDSVFLEEQTAPDMKRSVRPVEAYFSEGLSAGALPSAMFSLAYMLRSLSLDGAYSDGTLERYFASGLHKRARILFALPDLETTAENSTLLELLRVFSQLPGVETITLSERPGELERDFQAYSHVQTLEEDLLSECSEHEPLDQKIDAFLSVLGANGPAIAICDQPERSEIFSALSARGIPVISIIGKLGESLLPDRLPAIVKCSSALLFHSPAGLENVRLDGVLKLPRDGSACVQFIEERSGRLPDRSGARLRMGVPEYAKVVLGGGGLTLEAGLEEFVSIARRYLQQDDHAEDHYFVWVGEGPTHPHSLHFYVSLHNTLAELDHRILFAPTDLDVRSLCEAADVVLQPASPDPAVPFVLEAMAAGCPMVISFAAGAFDQLFDPEFCVSYGDCDLDAACEALRALMRDGALYRRKSAAAGLKMTEQWSFAALVNRLIETVNRHAGKLIKLPAYQPAASRKWNIYMRGRAGEFAVLRALQAHLSIADWKLICVGGRLEPDIDGVIAAAAAEDHAVYQAADDEKVSLETTLKAAIFDHSAPKSVFLDLQDALTECALHRCTGQRLLLLTSQADITGKLYDLGLMFDEIYVSDSDLVEQMHALNPLIASRMIALETGVETEQLIRSSAGQI